MVHSIACLSEAVLIIAGTALSMADSVELISLIAKVSERPSQCKLHVNWLSWDSRDLEILFNNLLELDKLKHAIGEEYYETLKQRVVGIKTLFKGALNIKLTLFIFGRSRAVWAFNCRTTINGGAHCGKTS